MIKAFTFLFMTISLFCGAQSKTVVISEVYGGGGNLNSTYKHDYIQIFNLSSSPVDLSTYSLQIAETAGSEWSVINLSGVVQANHWYLIEGNSEGAYGADLPASDANGNFNLNTGSGKLALVNSGTKLTTSCVPFTENVVDFIGYGKVDCSETSAAPAHTITTATSRINFAADANNNFADFKVFPPNPRNALQIALPITLNIFTVSKNDKGNNIHWQVNCLSTSATFAIERSPDLQNFIAIYSSTETKVRCATPFDVTDTGPKNGENYYRLKIIDIDGNLSYSKISLSVNTLRGRNVIRITPNIVTSMAEMHYYSDKSEKMQLEIFDSQGKTVGKSAIEVVAGDNKVLIPTNNFSKGQYRVFLSESGHKIGGVPFIKQ